MCVTEVIANLILWHEQITEPLGKTEDEATEKREVTSLYIWNGRNLRLKVL